MKTVWDAYKIHYEAESGKLPIMEPLKKGFGSEQEAQDWIFRIYNLMTLSYRDYQIWPRIS
ncbi:hypothetical protein AWW67_07580 [Roseivirga seohaensis]|uniref:Uncharacterized protein n=1 Tax=Roseivirga seohaensis TaxID=1914963 RepID=A0A150XR40_9BACT|nr:hypothetical protein AWW67_07580 [Roseivirga seohaensis]